MKELESRKDQELAELKESYHKEKTGLIAAFEAAKKKAEFETQQRLAQDQRIREELQQNYEKHMKKRDREVRKKIEESEEHNQKTKVHWVEKFKELEKTIAGLREKQAKEKETLEGKLEELKEVELKQLNSIVLLKKQLKEAEDSGKEMREKWEKELGVRVRKEQELSQMSEWALNSQKEVSFHLQVKKQWKAEIESLQQ